MKSYGARLPRWLPAVAACALPVAFSFWLYWLGLWTWFHEDDFAWLGLLRQIHNWRDLAAALLRPTSVQGSWRPLGERAYYLGLEALFGPRALPFRALAFATQSVNLVLAAVIVRRLTRSWLAGSLAAVLWAANSTLVVVMTWSAEYMLILCGFFLLSAFLLFLLHTAEGERRYLIGCWVMFVLGFGALETNVIFPLLAASYAALFARAYLRKTVPMFAVSALYAVLHVWLAPASAASLYAPRFHPFEMLRTFGAYWRLAFEPVTFVDLGVFPEWLLPVGTAVFTLAVVSYAGWQARRGRWLPVWCLAWFLVTLLPVLPLPAHISEYYVTLPALGLGMLGGAAIAQAWREGWVWRAAAIMLVAGFLAEQAPCTRLSTRWFFDRSHRIERWLKDVAQASRDNPGKILLLDGLNDTLFWGAVRHHPFPVMGVAEAYLAPGVEDHITPHPEIGSVAEFVLSPERVQEALAQNRLEVYEALPSGLVRTTENWRGGAAGPPSMPWRFDVTGVDPGRRLGVGWYDVDGGVRWMSQRASIRLPAPDRAGRQLVVRAYCTHGLLEHGPVKLTIRLEGSAARTTELMKGDEMFTVEVPLPPDLVGRKQVNATFELDRSFRAGGDRRDLGIAFGTVEIR